MPGVIELFIGLIISAICFGIPIYLIVILLRNRRENIRLRLEVGKLADELEKERKSKPNESS